MEEIAHRLSRGDADMVARYQSRSDLAPYDVRSIFRPGDQVLVNQKIVGKLKSWCIGPFVFVYYMGYRGINAEL